jgi:hypothetical protein
MHRNRINHNDAGACRGGVEALEARMMFDVVPLLAPRVISAEFDDSRAPHELRVRFSDDVWQSLDHTDLVLINELSRQPFPTERMTINWDADTNTAHFVFVRAEGGVLDEGTWHATLVSEGIFGDSGYALDGDDDELPGGNHELTFNYNAADINHDGAVNLFDFNVLSSNFGRTGATRADGDLNYDGRVNLNDFRILAERFNTEIDGGGRVGGAFAPTQSSSISKAASRPSKTLDLLA